MSYVGGICKDSSGAGLAGQKVRLYRRDTGLLLDEKVSDDGTTGPQYVDPHWAMVQLYLKLTGSNHATTFPDSSGLASTVTGTGGIEINNDYLFNTVNTLRVNGSGQSLTVPSNAAFAPGTGDWCFETNWILDSNAFTNSAFHTIFNLGQYNTGIFVRFISGNVDIYILGAQYLFPYTVPLGGTTLHYLRVARKAGVMKVYADGVLLGSATANGTIPANNITIGVSAHAGGERFYGALANMRFTVGESREPLVLPASNFYPDSTDVFTLAAGGFRLVTDYSGDCYVVQLDDSGADENAQIYDLVTPV